MGSFRCWMVCHRCKVGFEYGRMVEYREGIPEARSSDIQEALRWKFEARHRFCLLNEHTPVRDGLVWVEGCHWPFGYGEAFSPLERLALAGLRG